MSARAILLGASQGRARYTEHVLVEAVIEQALKLSVEERAELVARLVESLDGPAAADPGREAAWTDVIDRRLQEARSGQVKMIPADEAMAQVRAAVAARRRR